MEQMKVIEGTKVYLTTSVKEAKKMYQGLGCCKNCVHYKSPNLFGGICEHPELSYSFGVEFDNCCECFYAKEKIMSYWLQKLAEIIMEYNGTNDKVRKFFAKERKKHVKKENDMKESVKKESKLIDLAKRAKENTSIDSDCCHFKAYAALSGVVYKIPAWAIFSLAASISLAGDTESFLHEIEVLQQKAVEIQKSKEV
jgi:hypothetical protein